MRKYRHQNSPRPDPTRNFPFMPPPVRRARAERPGLRVVVQLTALATSLGGTGLTFAAHSPGTHPARPVRRKGIRVIARSARVDSGEGWFTRPAQTILRVADRTAAMGRRFAANWASATGFPTRILPEVPGVPRLNAIAP